MKPEKLNHATTVVERHFGGIAPARVFAAWADPEQRAQWDVPGGDDWVLVELSADFRAGGREKMRFGPRGDPRYWSEGQYLDIVPDQRIISAGVMHDGDRPTSATLCTVEFRRERDGTQLVLTDQSAYLGGSEAPPDRHAGWGEILDRLVDFIGRAS